MFYTEKEKEIYKYYYKLKNEKKKDIAGKVSKKFKLSRSYIFELVKIIDDNIYRDSLYYKKFLNENLDIKWEYKYLKRYEDYKKNRKNRNDIEGKKQIIEDMLFDGFVFSKIEKYLNITNLSSLLQK